MKTRVAVVGATGYTGVELIRFISSHPRAELSKITSKEYVGEDISNVFGTLRGIVGLKVEPLDIESLCKACDFVFAALPHKAAMEIVPELLKRGKKVVDLSADFRFEDVAIYEKWYQKHVAPEAAKSAVYGLPELHRAKIKKADLVANPGCYPTSAILGLAPALKAGIISTKGIVVDSKSGTSGTSRAANVDTHFVEVNEGFKAYGVPNHRHMPEIEKELSKIAGTDVVITFAPHLLPLNRGILSTIYSMLEKDVSEQDIYALYRKFYKGERFIRILPEKYLPNVNSVRGSNYCDIGLRVDSRAGRLVVVSAIDNLVKGASGQAVQNMNVILGFEESAGLDFIHPCP
jgi:N-acetyl-gamma-glutamyl-phosphate reductase